MYSHLPTIHSCSRKLLLQWSHNMFTSFCDVDALTRRNQSINSLLKNRLEAFKRRPIKHGYCASTPLHPNCSLSLSVIKLTSVSETFRHASLL